MADNRRVDFDAVKARADFRAVLAHYGLPEGRGAQFKIVCPFHDDREPSCSVNAEQGLFHCFGAGCGAEGNVLDFVHRLETRDGAPVTIRQAAIRLAEICGIPLEEVSAAGRRQGRAGKGEKARVADHAPREPKPAPEPPGGPQRAPEEEPERAINRPLGFALTLAPGHPYLKERGISPELAEHFGLGYCEKGIMRGRLAIPIHDAQGQLVAYAGRWVGADDTLPEGEGRYKLPPGFQKTLELFNLHRVRHCRHLVVVEGYFGTIRLRGERIPAVGLMGGSVSEQQIALLLEHCPSLRFLTVMLDGDQPGREAADKVAVRLARHWWVRLADLPDGDQPDTASLPTLNLLLRRTQPEAA